MKLLKIITLLAALLTVPFSQAQELPYSLQQMLNTEAYVGTLKSMVNPDTIQNPIALCASCHNGEEMARYTQTLGPMMQMINPVNWVNPMAYWNMMVPMMDPKSYEMWYNDYVKKYGTALGIGGHNQAEEQQ